MKTVFCLDAVLIGLLLAAVAGGAQPTVVVRGEVLELLAGQRDDEGRPFSGCRGGGDRAAEKLEDSVCDREPQAQRASRAAREASLGAPKRLEYV